jgi:two-component SAPR family response regulator
MKKIEIVLAESDPTQVAIIRSNISNDFQEIIQTVKNFSELLEAVIQNKPQLVILGRLDKFNYFEIGKDLHEIQKNLQIVFIFRGGGSQTLIVKPYKMLALR